MTFILQGKAIKYHFFSVFLFLGVFSFSQHMRFEGNVERLPNEHFEDFVYRIILEEDDLIETDSAQPWVIVYQPVELQFGHSDKMRIVFAFKRYGEDFIEIGILTLKNDEFYKLESFGEFVYGFPTSDEIISIFAFNVDIDIDLNKELCVIGKGESKTVNEDGMIGCCTAFYQTDIFYEVEEKHYTTVQGGHYNSTYYFKSFNEYDGFSLWSTVNEVKASIHRHYYNTVYAYNYKDFEKKTDYYITKHLELLDSVDRVYSIESNRKVIDNVYKLDLGTNQKKYVLSLTRTVENIDFYSLGIFTIENNNTVSYVESPKIELNNYQNFKNYKVETIFSYDVDKMGEIKHKEIVVLLSGDELHQNSGRKWAVFVGFPTSDNSIIRFVEGWHYGISKERSAGEIKKAIEKFHNSK